MQITGAELLVKALLAEKVDMLFAYPGGQVIDIFDALYGVEEFDVMIPRHEQALIHAADGYARSTGKTGVCLVTSGPGAANLVTGIATANYDSVPLVCFTGQVPTCMMGQNAFQEVDIVSITKSISKYAVTVRTREELAVTIKKAFAIAQTGKPGVVVVDLPKDIQQALGSDDYPETTEVLEAASGPVICREQVDMVSEYLDKAARPLFLLGGGVNISHANREMVKLVERTGIPVVSTIMGKGAVPTGHPLYIGNIGIHGSYAANTAVSECDLLIAIGVRFNDRVTGKVSEFAKKAVIIRIDIDPDSISGNVPVDLSIAADAKDAVMALLAKIPVLDFESWVTKITKWDKRNPLGLEQKSRKAVTPLSVIKKINEIYDDAVITTDVGQNQLWTTQFLELTQKKQLITSGGLGTMGFGFPAAIGAKLGNPAKDVISINGDGGIQMIIQEMATAVVYELPVVICIFNNGYLGNVRQWQEMFFDKRYAGTCLRYRKSCQKTCSNPTVHCPEYLPDFIQLAKSYGAWAVRVWKYEDIEYALKEAKNRKKVPSVIEFMIEREENVLPIVPPGSPVSDMIV